jgi:hypothetical protein
VYDLARGRDWRLCELKEEKASLEAVFNRLTAEGGAR